MREERQLLTIIMTPDIEDTILDWLLEQPDIERFNSYHVKSFNKDHSNYTSLEKVTGWKRRIAVQIILTSTSLHTVVEGMKIKFAHSNIDYRVSPFLDEGIL